MKFRGRIKDIMEDVRNGGFILSFQVKAVPSGADRLREETDLAISVTEWREHRSLTANAYYWVLVSKISEVTGNSNAVVHNLLLRSYGVPEIVDGQLLTVMVRDTEEAEQETLEKEIYHLKPTSKLRVGRNGQMFRAYYMLKGSSDFDTKEMARLIDGAIEEAKLLDIDTVSETEVRRMLELYEINHAK